MKSLILFKILLTIQLITIGISISEDIQCNIAKNCKLLELLRSNHEKVISCKLKKTSRLVFTHNNSTISNGKAGCTIEKQEHLLFNIASALFESNTRLSEKVIDLKSWIQYISMVNATFHVSFSSISSFELDLFESDVEIDILMRNTKVIFLSCNLCAFQFYKGEQTIKSCDDFTNQTSPRSIFQLFSKFNSRTLSLLLTQNKYKLCPLIFNNVNFNEVYIIGENSYFSQSTLSFSNETFDKLNSSISDIFVYVENVDLDFRFLHPSVFQNMRVLVIKSKVRSIKANLFRSAFKSLRQIDCEAEHFRSLNHIAGIEWIKSINNDLAFLNLSDIYQIYEHLPRSKFILLNCLNNAVTPSMADVFPDEDFCLYKDFPFNQLVILIHGCTSRTFLYADRRKLTCTYLWLIQHYRSFNFDPDFPYFEHIITLVKSVEFRSVSKCNFKSRIDNCNRSNYQVKSVVTYFDIYESMFLVNTVLNILSYILPVFGVVTNVLTIVTISKKANKAEFKDLKQYHYMRINSICSCFILCIHFISWLSDCVYPYQVFCSEVRKTLFFQYLKIIGVEILTTLLRFINNFIYVGFAFSRISLIGKDHNKLIKFISDLSVFKFTFASLILSMCLSVVKFFSYRVNKGDPTSSYPMQFDYESIRIDEVDFTPIYFIFNFISDLLNYQVFLFVHLSIDIGMVVKLKQTLNEKLEKSKAYISKDQQEKKEKENETVLDDAVYMVILNSVVGTLLKLPLFLYSLIYFYYSIYRMNDLNFLNHPGFGRFYTRFCIDAYFCDMFHTLADFMYSLLISIHFFVSKRFDRKFRAAFERAFYSKKN